MRKRKPKILPPSILIGGMELESPPPMSKRFFSFFMSKLSIGHKVRNTPVTIPHPVVNNVTAPPAKKNT